MRRLVLAVVLCFGVAACEDEPDRRTRTHEILSERPSGFWTSNRPAENGAYRWRLLGIGVVLVLVTGLVTWRLIKRANAARAAR
jgi:hypothetical protein